MAARSPEVAAIAAAHRARNRSDRAEAASRAAKEEYRSALAECVRLGVSYSELGRQFTTSPARIREQVLAAK